jgi:cytochrome c oxidase subunit 1
MSVSHTPAAHAHPEFSFLRKYIFSEDHKVIGIQFFFSGLIFLFIGGALALMVRIQLGWPASTAPLIARCSPRAGGRGCRKTSTP